MTRTLWNTREIKKKKILHFMFSAGQCQSTEKCYENVRWREGRAKL